MDRNPPLTEMDANSEWFGSDPPEPDALEPQEPSLLPRDEAEMDRVIFESLVSPLV